MDGIRSDILGAPGGRTKYPITMRRIKLDVPMDTSAIIKTRGVIVESGIFSSPNGRAAAQSESLTDRGFQANQTGKEHRVFFGRQNSIEFVPA